MSSRSFFVYGTLKRGQCRETCWPAEPLSVATGFVRGALLCLGPFPGLVPGDEWVRGEIWEIAADNIEATLRVLDEIEEFEPHGCDNFYERELVAVYAAVGDIAPVASAYTYWLVNGDACSHGDPVCRADGQEFVDWREGATS